MCLGDPVNAFIYINIMVYTHYTSILYIHIQFEVYRVFLTVTPLKVSDYVVNPIKKVSEFTYRQ